MPVPQTRYAGPMVLKKLTQTQVEALRCATKAEGCRILHLLMRVTDKCETLSSEGTKEERFTVWLCAKAVQRISVCMWAKQLGVRCIQSEDVFPTKEMKENGKEHAMAYDTAIREARDKDGWEYEEFECSPVITTTTTKRDSSSDVETVPPLVQVDAGAQADDKQKTEIEASSTSKRVPVDPKNVNESLWLWLDNQRHFPDGVELWSRTPKEVWAFFKTCIPGWSEWKKGAKMCPTTYVPTFAKAMQKHRMSKPEWKAYAKERLEHATVPASAVEPKPQEKAEESAAPCKRQKCVNGDVSGAPRVAQGLGSEGGSKARIDEQLLRYLTDQRRFDDGEELLSKAPEDVWMQLQLCAHRWYTSKKQEPCQDTHRPTLVKAMRTHEMSTTQWGAYALSRL